jgi:hypothetical protein
MATKPKLIKVRLTNEGADSETPWAHDLGRVEGGRKVKLVNVPFMHAKPTWGDTIVVKEIKGDFPTWDRGGTPWGKISSRILVDGGRWAMIVHYEPHPDGKDAFKALDKACLDHDIICEGAVGPRNGRPGTAYLAVPVALSDTHVMKALRDEELPCELTQVHPKPSAKPKKKPVKKKAKKR